MAKAAHENADMAGQPLAVVIMVAVADNGVIGDGAAMPWHLPGDLRRLKALTMGKPLIMGRRTYQSIGRPLPGRANIVLTRDPAFTAEGIITVDCFAAALDAARQWAGARQATEIIIFGGAEIYALGLPIATRMEWTEVHSQPMGGTRFPEFDRGQWQEVARQGVAAKDGAPAHEYVTLVRKN